GVTERAPRPRARARAQHPNRESLGDHRRGSLSERPLVGQSARGGELNGGAELPLGRSTTNRAPPPSALAAWTVPPWARTTSATMARPRPAAARPRRPPRCVG